VRTWHPELLVLNSFVLILAALAFFRYKIFWLHTKTGISIIAVFIVTAVECIAIIPEQRFSIGAMIFFWLISLTFVSVEIKIFIDKFITAQNIK
jgi:hypothetical protein